MAPTSANSPTAGEVNGLTNVKAPEPVKPDATVKAEKSTETTAAASGSEVTVEFVGVPPFGRDFHRERSIDKKAWDSLGIDSGKLTWNQSNGWKVNVPADNEALLDYFRTNGSGFKVRD